MSPVLARRILREAVRRGGSAPTSAPVAPPAPPRLRFFEDLFEKQQTFILDPSDRKAALCTRRAGKSHACAAYLLKVGFENPDTTSVYIALSRQQAKRNMWKVLRRLDKKYKLGLGFNVSELTIELPNGSLIYLVGANNEDDAEKLRGDKFALVVCDEAASFRAHFESMIEEVIEPALMDLRGTLCMIGTPAAHCSGYFHDVTQGLKTGWAVHKWTLYENPYVEDPRAYVEKKKKEKGWADDNPVLLREWFGRWVRSDDSMVYKFGDKNLYKELPKGVSGWQYVLGADLGWHDADAYSVIAFHPDQPDAYEVHTEKRSKQDVTAFAEGLKALQEKWKPVRTVVDTGGLGKKIVEELRSRFALTVHPAEKTEKFSYIELMNGDLATGRFHVLDSSPLVEEWKLLQWDEAKRKEDDRFENHASDACLYAWREAKHWTYQPPPDPGPKRHTSEWHQQRAREEEEADERRHREADQNTWKGW